MFNLKFKCLQNKKYGEKTYDTVAGEKKGGCDLWGFFFRKI